MLKKYCFSSCMAETSPKVFSSPRAVTPLDAPQSHMVQFYSLYFSNSCQELQGAAVKC